MKKTKPVLGLNLFASLFDDCVAREPDLHQSLLTKDLPWLKRLIESRGLPFIMIDMPEAGKVVDQALSRERLDPNDLPQTFGKIRGGSRQFLYCLFSQVFDDEGILKPDVAISAVRNLRQVLYLAKKAKMACSDAAIEAEVVTFRAIDDELRSSSLTWDEDGGLHMSPWGNVNLTGLSLVDCLAEHPIDPCQDLFDKDLLKVVQAVSDNLMSRWSAEFDWRSVFPKHGPGVVADAKRGTDKYLFPSWPNKLERVFPHSYFANSSEYEAYANPEDDQYNLNQEFPVRLLAVPKTLKGPRMVASEPTSHQFIQLGLMRWMREHLPQPLKHCLNFRDQEPSRRLCVIASLGGHLATVDLSSASDRLSCWTVERVFRRSPDLLDAFQACRTRWLVNATGHGDPYLIRLNKYAPMGNGTTFPVQSIVYAIMSIASIIYTDGSLVNNKTIDAAARGVRVFGDDIIISSSAVPNLTRVLELNQLKVNQMKTHITGRFRESCGMDAFRGQDVTPVYLASLELSHSPEGLVSWTDVVKNARKAELFRLEEALSDMIPEGTLAKMPRTDWNLGCLSLPSYYGVSLTLPDAMKRRYNRNLFRWEIYALALEAKPVRVKRETDANLVQYWTDSPKPDS
ncbi:RNA-directed RNA polymerase, partial [ssRNA phage Zoerhiza.4_22]